MFLKNIVDKTITKSFIRLRSNQKIMANENFDHLKLFIKCKHVLSKENHKGQAGRIGIVGGSLEYTGAPYFSAISALRAGADLVHIFCTSTASTVIKSYSPELIVHPLLDDKEAVSKISSWLDRLHAILIGPGLGRETETMDVVSDLIGVIKKKKIPLVIDADGLHLITEFPNLLRDFKSPIILTPNSIEYQRLDKKLNGNILHYFGENVVVLKKGQKDEFFAVDKQVEWNCDLGGSNRRCGGQGDILSGVIATFLVWTMNNKDALKYVNNQAACSLSCYAASRLVRMCNEKAFKNKGRSMLSSDMIEYIHESFEELFGQ